jgi:hypothetical protein
MDRFYRKNRDPNANEKSMTDFSGTVFDRGRDRDCRFEIGIRLRNDVLLKLFLTRAGHLRMIQDRQPRAGRKGIDHFLPCFLQSNFFPLGISEREPTPRHNTPVHPVFGFPIQTALNRPVFLPPESSIRPVQAKMTLTAIIPRKTPHSGRLQVPGNEYSGVVLTPYWKNRGSG